MQERRKYIRYDIDGSAVLKIDGQMLGTIKGELVNIGFQGMSVYVPEKIEEGINVKFELTTKLYDRPVVGEGKIIYVKIIKRYDTNVFRIGIEFLNFDRKAIQYIIARIQEGICLEARKKRTF
jgi:hypothetical protein